ncbi:hypothetical protein PIB30_043281 [Stylosanthes scabra]|uniref:Uncharacterized protein n=1 Tax=Stylosanthes scabra TaxID=79078 RepID=A0ABU6WFG2_9FABA|nr:hypothetical protein [Stylosanthes scabra]
MGADCDALQSFTYRCFLPLVVVLQASQHDLLNQITEWFMDVVVETHAWGVLEVALVPIFLRSVGFSICMLHSGDLDFYEWSSKPFFQGSYDVIIDPLKDKELLLSSSSTFTLRTSCNVLSVVMEGALQCVQAHTLFKPAGEECCLAINFIKTLIWDLCNMTERMLLHSPDHRSCAVGFFLPIVHKAFLASRKFEISIRGWKHEISR